MKSYVGHSYHSSEHRKHKEMTGVGGNTGNSQAKGAAHPKGRRGWDIKGRGTDTARSPHGIPNKAKNFII